jgi:hypothetical protein
MDGALRNGLAFAPIVNCHGLWANQPSGPNGIFGDHPAAPKTTRSAMWLAAVTTDMISELVFILQGSSDKWANELTPGGETTAVLSLTVLTFVPSLSWQSIGFYGFHEFRGNSKAAVGFVILSYRRLAPDGSGATVGGGDASNAPILPKAVRGGAKMRNAFETLFRAMSLSHENRSLAKIGSGQVYQGKEMHCSKSLYCETGAASGADGHVGDSPPPWGFYCGANTAFLSHLYI